MTSTYLTCSSLKISSPRSCTQVFVYLEQTTAKSSSTKREKQSMGSNYYTPSPSCVTIFLKKLNYMHMAILLYALTCLSLSISFSIAEDQPRVIEPAEDKCAPDRCRRHHGPVVQFPFWLSNREPAHCGYPDPGFNLSCSEDNRTLLSFPNSGMLYVTEINYKTQVIRVQDSNHCLPLRLTYRNRSSLSFHYYPYQDYAFNYTLFNCSTQDRDEQKDDTPGEKLPCLSVPGYDVYAISSSIDIAYLPLVGCETTGNNIDSLPDYIHKIMDEISLEWQEPNCGHCANAGCRCRLKNGTRSKTECFVVPKSDSHAKLVRLEASLGVVVSFLLFMVLGGLCYIHRKKRKDKENQKKIERFLEDYKAFKPTRYTYADVKRITSQFKEKLGEGAYGNVYKGKLSNEIFVAVKILNNSIGKGEEFINEVGTMGRIHHVNVVRLVGFCADGFRRALVYEFLPNESLERYIFPANDAPNPSLSWEKLEDIALGAAKGIEYLHQGCDQRILHFDIKPHNILLDDNFNPKISDFGLAKLCSKSQSAVSMTAARGTMGYIAPEVFSRNFGNVSYKSDVYSFGMLLLEMVGGRKNKDVAYQDTSRIDFPEWVYNHLDRGEEIEFRSGVEGDSKIARKMATVGLWCIQWYPADRPSMKTVVQMLEVEECPVVPRNPFASGNAADGGNARARIWNLELEVIAE